MTELGRRERKKLQTRQSIADAALELFMARGFDDVGVKEIADRADVSVTTLFKHFPSKEALLFDEDEEMESALVDAVRNRQGRSIPQALKEHFAGMAAGHADHPLFQPFIELVESTPSLRAYQRTMWIRHETALARAIAEEIGAPPDDVRCAGLARFALESRDVIFGRQDREQAAEALFGLLEHGWSADQQA
ncbi:TetR family transcriptional regulator [Lentzea aerocolonigenes]|uniref:TetR family transcriptional regulator n=1 Tax=Lentzea aerocolonigenes TaxID=68170 RepID=A0A0F0H0S2_LENAE|nr:TetR/AcrR family transcriptional regulator [Lentzea aerocolonigenes]KJK49319.1 TetR family transcriptional regulator [Lentzea aerocolonigenes]